MGYDIMSSKSKKAQDESCDNILSHIQCQYAYQPYFREAFNREITDWNGRLIKSKREEFIKGIDNFIGILEKGIDVPMYRGNLSNCSQETLIKEFRELKELIKDGKIGYMSIS
jgi:hypothetical protein